MNRRWSLILLVVLLLTDPVSVFAEVAAPVLAAEQARLEQSADGLASAYELDLILDPAARTIGGREEIRFVNHTGYAIDLVTFRLYPNADYYDEGMIEVQSATVDGRIVRPRYDASGTTLWLDLAAPLQPRAQAEIVLWFTTTVPADSDGSYGILSFVTATETWVLADFYPILAGWDPETGWRTDLPIPDGGDPTYADAATYDLAIAAPEELRVIATGVESRTDGADGQSLWSIQTGLVREFTLVADAGLTSRSATLRGTEIRVWGDPSLVTPESMRLQLASARRSLKVYGRDFGAYPYAELDLVAVPLPGALGVSWSGLIFLNTDHVGDTGDPAGIDFTVAHETGHQWWGGLIGINSNDHAFLSEGLTNYLTYRYVLETQGELAADAVLDVYIVRPYVNALNVHGDGIADRPFAEFPRVPWPGALIYGKAALGFMAIEREIGSAAFVAGINAWAGAHVVRIGEPETLQVALEVAGGKQLAALWTRWFQQAVTTPEDVVALIDG